MGILKIILDMLFPVECLGCNKANFLLCDKCFLKIEKFKDPKPTSSNIDNVLIACSFKETLIKKIVHFYKYNYIRDLSTPLSKLIINLYKEQIEKLENPIVICAPLSKKRLRLRCFNQAELLAKEFSKYFDYEFVDNLIIKSRDTKQQAKLNRVQRLKNIKNCFFTKFPEIIKNRNFIIIDDIYTTGTTVNEIAGVLKNNLANKVWCLVIAKD